MTALEWIFWISLFLTFYTFVGYGILLFFLIRIKRLWSPPQMIKIVEEDLPTCALIIAAYNEESYIREKIQNTLALQYPQGKLEIYFVTDGSTDATPQIVQEFPNQLHLRHEDARRGKIAAVHRVVEEVQAELIIFTDANTFLNKEALMLMARHFADPRVGAVSGEKRVAMEESADASSAGEGFYWKYESALKKWDSELYSVVGTAGELFGIRRSLYVPVPSDTLLDDFMISMRIAEQGYKVVYEPHAYAVEQASENVREELKRKIRIAAGGVQSIVRLPRLFNVFAFPMLSFQYISHRVLRWTITPWLMIVMFVLNAVLAMEIGGIYLWLMIGQIAFYGLALLGWALSTQSIKFKITFIPYYFCVMNYAVIAGLFRYLRGKQSVVWEKASRKM
jgi:biofilm PGA synthesis N-glycosyltransferase PgaC